VTPLTCCNSCNPCNSCQNAIASLRLLQFFFGWLPDLFYPTAPYPRPSGSHQWLHQNKIITHKLEHPIEVYNINGSVNRGGSITEVTLISSYQGHKECAVFKVCDLGKSNLIIGYTWLHKHSPEINWETGKVEMMRCPRECNVAERR